MLSAKSIFINSYVLPYVKGNLGNNIRRKTLDHQIAYHQERIRVLEQYRKEAQLISSNKRRERQLFNIDSELKQCRYTLKSLSM